MRRIFILRFAALWFLLIGAAGCTALSSIDAASKPQDTYELTALPAGAVSAPRSGRTLEVSLPTATGALTSDLIVIKPTPLQVQALPDVRWVNEAHEHLQLLLVRSIANSGRFSLVSAGGSGPRADYLLMTDLQSFQAEVVAQGVEVRIQTRMTLLSDLNGRVVSSRSFDTSRLVADSSANLILAAFDEAMTEHLTEAVNWLARLRGL